MLCQPSPSQAVSKNTSVRGLRLVPGCRGKITVQYCTLLRMKSVQQVGCAHLSVILSSANSQASILRQPSSAFRQLPQQPGVCLSCSKGVRWKVNKLQKQAVLKTSFQCR